MAEESRPVLVTGATGFIGSWIVAALVRAGRAVVAADLHTASTRLDQVLPPKDQQNIRRVSCDVSDTAAVHRLVTETAPGAVIHLAALQIPACRANPVLCAQVNVVGQVNIFEAARQAGVEKIVYTSSAAAKPRGPANAPANLYGVFKKTDEEIARIFWEEHGISSLGLRPYIVYGVGRDDGETSAITRAMRAAALGERYQIPFRTRGCMEYASEVADIFSRTAEATWEGALVSDLTTQTSSIEDVLEAIHACVPDARITAADTVRVAPEIGLDNSVLADVIGDWPRVSLREGTRRTIAHYRSLAGKA
ncbi:MAG: NAD(P)-dependent oxidoreductase [Rhodospirillales bacterium]